MMKYAMFTTEFPHYQIAKFNGTKGHCTMKNGDVGIYDEKSDTYIFEERNGIVPQFISGLFCNRSGVPIFIKLFDSIHKGKFYDDQHQEHVERLDIRLIKAKSQIDLDWAWIAFYAAEENRLSIKLSVHKLFNQ